MQLTTGQSQQISASAFLVTGGGGFIGSHIAEFLLNNGARKVRVLDNLATGNFRNILPFAKHADFEFVKGDIRDFETCKAACQGIDYVIHQAALGSVPRSINDPVTTNNVNASGFLNMLTAAQGAKVKRFVYASSSSVYGDDSELPKTEKIIGRPLSPYAVTKYINELYADLFARQYGLETIGLRYFNVFGQRQDPRSTYAAVIPKFVTLLIGHESPIINGTGEYSRDFTYVENVVQANILAALTTNSKAINQVYNIACGERTSLNQLVKLLKELLSVFDKKIADIEIIHGPFRIGDVAHSQASVEKAKTLLGYQPQYSLRKGLLQSVSWYWSSLPQFEMEEK